jgi:hypothetical protein
VDYLQKASETSSVSRPYHGVSSKNALRFVLSSSDVVLKVAKTISIKIYIVAVKLSFGKMANTSRPPYRYVWMCENNV